MQEEWIRRDLAVLWHPCTQMHDHELAPPIPIRSGRGVWLEDFTGRRYLDAISSWWTNLFGHCHPHIVARVQEQAARLEHVLLAGFSHAPAIELAERLVAIAPPGLERVFYADNGSSAIEVALKMSFHYWRNLGEHRPRFVALENGYHGETLGALSLTDVPPLIARLTSRCCSNRCSPHPPTPTRAEPGESAESVAMRRLGRGWRKSSRGTRARSRP